MLQRDMPVALCLCRRTRRGVLRDRAQDALLLVQPRVAQAWGGSVRAARGEISVDASMKAKILSCAHRR